MTDKYDPQNPTTWPRTLVTYAVRRWQAGDRSPLAEAGMKEAARRITPSQRKPAPAAPRYTAQNAPKAVADWSPERVADAERQWQAGKRSPYVTTGHTEHVSRVAHRARKDAEAAVRTIQRGDGDKAAAVAHIEALHAQGVPYETIRRLGQINPDTWQRAMNPDVTRMTKVIADKIMAIQPETPAVYAEAS